MQTEAVAVKQWLEVGELFVGLVQALAWPFTLAILILIFRKQILSAARRVGSIKYGDLQVTINDVAREVEAPESQSELESKEPEPPPDMTSEDRAHLEALALDQALEEFPDLSRYVMMFDRPDFAFDGAAQQKSTFIVFEVVVLGRRKTLPNTHVEAVMARFQDLRNESTQRTLYQIQFKLVFLCVTSLTGDDRLELETEVRRYFARRRHIEVRLYGQNALLDREGGEAVDNPPE